MRLAAPLALALAVLAAPARALVESGGTVLTRAAPWAHLSRFSFSGGAQGKISGTITRVDPLLEPLRSVASVYLYCEFELEKVESLREDLKLEVGSKEECEQLTAAGIYLRTAALEPDAETGVAAFTLEVPVVPDERVCTVALADCSLAAGVRDLGVDLVHSDVANLFSSRGRKGLMDKFLHWITAHQGVMPPLMGLGVFGMLPGLVSGLVSMANADRVLAFSGHFMSAEFKKKINWSPHGYELLFENGDSHLPAEEAWLPQMYLVLTLTLMAYVPVYRSMVKRHQLVGKSRDHITTWVTALL